MLNSKELSEWFNTIEDCIVECLKKKTSKEEMGIIVKELLLNGFSGDYDNVLDVGFSHIYEDEVVLSNCTELYKVFAENHPDLIEKDSKELLEDGVEESELEYRLTEIYYNDDDLKDTAFDLEMENGNENKMLDKGIELIIKEVKRKKINQNQSNTKNQ